MAAGAVRALNIHDIPVSNGVVVAAARPAGDAPPALGGALPVSVELRVGDHPVPDIGSLAAADVIARHVLAVQEGDVALVLISGGATSLCAAPCDELLAEFGHAMPAQEVITQLIATLHTCGMTIQEMNAIRRRLLRWGGGRLAVQLYERGAVSVPVFAVSDVIGDEPSVIGSGPCSADLLTQVEFLAMLDAYELRSRISRELSVMLGLQGDPRDAIRLASPHHPAFDLVHFDIVARNRDARLALAAAARAHGISEVTVIDSPMSGDADTLGRMVATAAIKAATMSEREQLVVWGGEPTVRMPDDSDTGLDAPLGGRMQLLALSAALALEAAARDNYGDRALVGRVTVLAAGTDGRDGPTDACGAIVNAATPFAALAGGRDAARDLAAMQSYRALAAADALLKTGPTGTNVMDIVAVYIAPAAPAL